MSVESSLSQRGRFNYRACFFNFFGFLVGYSFFSPLTVIPLFVKHLSENTFWVGLVSAISSIGFFLPQLIAASWIQGMPFKRQYFCFVGIIERIPILLMALSVFIFGQSNPLVLLVATVVIFGVHTLAMGCNSPAYFDIVSKIVPTTVRGRMYGLAGALGGLFSILGAELARLYIKSFVFPFNFSLCFVTGFSVLLLTLIPMFFIYEPPSPSNQTTGLSQYFKETWVVFRTDHNFRTFICSQACISAFAVVVSFFTAYGRDKIGGSTSKLARLNTVFAAGSTVGNLFWGYVADKRGIRYMLLICVGLTIIATLLVMQITSISFLYISCMLISFATCCFDIQSFNFTLEFANTDKMPTYTALRASVIAPFRSMLLLISGLFIDWIGYRIVFTFCIILLFIAGLLLWQVKDPRHTI